MTLIKSRFIKREDMSKKLSQKPWLDIVPRIKLELDGPQDDVLGLHGKIVTLLRKMGYDVCV